MKQIRCNFCDSDNSSLLYKAKDRMIRRNDLREFNVVICGDCGLVCFNPQPEWKDLEYFYGDDYYTNFFANKNKKSAVYNLIRKAKRAVLGAYMPKFWDFGKKSGNFLNIGCGNGDYESYLIKNYQKWKFYGVEPNILSYQIAKTIDGFKVFNGDLKSARYKDNYFDVILMNHSLEHMPNPMENIAECFRILKPGGRLVVAVPNFNCFTRRLFGSYWFHLDAPRHLFHFSSDVLKAMLEKNNFKINSLKFEVLSGSIMRNIDYKLNRKECFFDKPFISLIIHYLIFPIDRFIELIGLASGLRIIAVKCKYN
ncbi:MAG: class I SAM-dependent methyltransferase [Patescibacteria group bacterium]|nr:class I SAM-dependent methyltransferase [Patescibacteria group bacterium]